MENTSRTPSRTNDLAILTLAFGLLFFLFLGAPPLANPDEGRYAEIPREMVETGDWLTPRLNGVAYFEKPPLTYWGVALVQVLLGPGEGALRAIPVLFSLGGIGLTYLATRRIFGRVAGVLAATVLGTSIFYFALSRILLLDMAVSVFVSATLFCFILGVRESRPTRRRALFHGLYLSAALATLSKGLMGVLLPGAVMFLWLLIFNQWRRLRPLYLPGGVGLFLLIAAPWHLLAAQRNPTWAHFYFVHEHWERFTTTVHARAQPWWYFAPVVLGGLFPWTGFLPGAFQAILGRWGQRREKADAWFFALWAGFMILFFSASQSKLPPYVLPAFPPLAVLIGAGLAGRTSGAPTGGVRGGIAVFGAVGGALAVALIVVALRPAVARIDGEAARELRPFAFAMAGLLIGGGLGSCWLAWRARTRAAIVGLLGTTGLFLAGLALANERIPRAGTRELARYVKATLPPDAALFHYHDFFHDFVFYAGRFVGTVEYHGDELELGNDPAARASGRFIAEAAFRERWLSGERIYAVVRKKKLRDLRRDYEAVLARPAGAAKDKREPSHPAGARPSVLIDPAIPLHVVCETADHYLLSNRPVRPDLPVSQEALRQIRSSPPPKRG